MIIGLLASLIIAEGLLLVLDIPPSPACFYALDENYGYKLKPDYSIELQQPEVGSYEVVTNSFGFRDDAFMNSPDKKNVFLVGDSFVMGLLLDKEQMFSSMLKNDPDLYEYLFFNLGIAASSTINQEQYIYKIAQDFPPEKVFIFFYMNDFPGNLNEDFSKIYSIKGDCLVVSVQDTSRSIKDWFDRNSRIYRLAKNAINNNPLTREFIEMTGLGDKYGIHDDLAHLSRVSNETWQLESEKTREILERLKTYSNENNFELTLVYIPYKLEFAAQRQKNAQIMVAVEKELDFNKARAELTKICAELDIPLIDLSQEIEGKSLTAYFEIDNHLTEEGNRIVANRIKEILVASQN